MPGPSSTRFQSFVAQEEERLRLLHPTSDDIPGCMTLFDEFLSCNMLGTQFKCLYRYGEMAQCKPKWSEFKFCMTINRMHPEERRRAWIRHRAEWWAKRRVGASSDNVWDVRSEPLKDYPPPPPNFDVPPPGLVD